VCVCERERTKRSDTRKPDVLDGVSGQGAGMYIEGAGVCRSGLGVGNQPELWELDDDDHD
jgi:hypothetical protein